MSCRLSMSLTATLFAMAAAVNAHAGDPPVNAHAADVTLGALTIGAPWARASAGMARAGAAFMTITNDGAADRLISADADVSDVVELHTHIKDGDVMRMRKVDAIDVAGAAVTHLQPGGLHIMFIGIHEAFQEGETFPLSLTFETAGTVEVIVTVQGVAAMGPGNTSHDHDHNHGHGHGAPH